MKEIAMTKRMILLAALMGLGLLPGAVLAQPKNSCLECHRGLEAELKAPAETFAQDIHQQFGLTCKDCHGGNPAQDDVDKAKDKTFKGAPKRALIPEFCARCHSDTAYMRQFNPNLRVDQLSQYVTSKHGQRLKAGDTKAAVCTDCHGVHGIQTAKYPKSMTFPWNIPQTCARCHSDPAYMKPYGIPTDQMAKYKESVHAQALFDKKDMSAPTCNSCHGNHGAFPPEVKSIGSVCRQCHPSNGELFAKSPHKKAFDDMGQSECEACHGNHKIERPTTAMLGTSDKSVCLQCHDKGSQGYAAAGELRALLDGFEKRVAANTATLELAEKKGVEVSDPVFKLKDVNTVLVSAKNLVHGLSLAEIRKKLGEGDQTLADVEKAGAAALDEAKFRRKGLIIATILLALFGVALFFKIRSMRKAD
jgi:predicted CXXCH cytochrome family protein